MKRVIYEMVDFKLIQLNGHCPVYFLLEAGEQIAFIYIDNCL